MQDILDQFGPNGGQGQGGQSGPENRGKSRSGRDGNNEEDHNKVNER